MALCLCLKETRKLHKYTHTHIPSIRFICSVIFVPLAGSSNTMKTSLEIMAAFDVNQDHSDNFPICGDIRAPMVAELFRNRKIEKYEEKISDMGSFSTFRNIMLVRMEVRRQVADIEITTHLLPVGMSYCEEGTGLRCKWTACSFNHQMNTVIMILSKMGQKFHKRFYWGKNFVNICCCFDWLSFRPARWRLPVF